VTDDILGAVAARRVELIELTRALVAHPSENAKLVSPEARPAAIAAERACQDTVQREYEALGMAIDRFEALPGREDVVGRLAGSGGGRSLILNGHVDVVPAGDVAAWPEDPWGGRVDGDGRLWGRGSCDMKGGIACGIVALRVLRDIGVRLHGDVVFQSVVDEETGGPGTVRAIERGHVADAAIVLEPTDRQLQPVEGGLEWVRVVIRGRTGHSAVRYRSIHAGGRGEPVSAIEKAVDVLLRIRELERYWGVHRVHPLLPRGITTINPGVIAGGSGGGADGMPNGMVAYSNMADYCALGLSMKYLPDERPGDVRAMFEDELARIAAADPWLREHPPEVEWGVSGVSFPPAETPPDHPFCQAVAGAFRTVAGRAETFSGFEAVSDLAWLSHAGVPSMLYGPGDFAQAHSSAEYVRVDELVEVTGVVALALCDWCGC
jgi:acetylornithine deacetylase/succinyl-diaminopimelate desuccinylase family protein